MNPNVSGAKNRQTLETLSLFHKARSGPYFTQTLPKLFQNSFYELFIVFIELFYFVKVYDHDNPITRNPCA